MTILLIICVCNAVMRFVIFGMAMVEGEHRLSELVNFLGWLVATILAAGYVFPGFIS